MAQRVQAEFTITLTSKSYAERSRSCYKLFQQAREAAERRWAEEEERKNEQKGGKQGADHQDEWQNLDMADYIEPNQGTGHENFIFLALCRTLGVIQALDGLDFKIRTFYDITGSGGLAPVAAGLLFEWRHIKVMECREDLLDRARNLVVACRLHCHDLHKANVLYSVGNPITSDFVEADVVFLDATQLGFDEVVFLHTLRHKLEDLVSGSYIIIVTHVEDPFSTDCPFLKLDCGPSYSIMEPCERHVLLYKTIRRSKDLRTEMSLRSSKTSINEAMQVTGRDATLRQTIMSRTLLASTVPLSPSVEIVTKPMSTLRLDDDTTKR